MIKKFLTVTLAISILLCGRLFAAERRQNMDAIVIFTIDMTSMDEKIKLDLDEEVKKLGLQKTLPNTEKESVFYLPEGTYGKIIQLKDDQMAQLTRYYRSLVDIMHKINFKGKYFVNVSTNPAYICGNL
jgi:hypothetical protein